MASNVAVSTKKGNDPPESAAEHPNQIIRTRGAMGKAEQIRRKVGPLLPFDQPVVSKAILIHKIEIMVAAVIIPNLVGS